MNKNTRGSGKHPLGPKTKKRKRARRSSTYGQASGSRAFTNTRSNNGRPSRNRNHSSRNHGNRGKKNIDINAFINKEAVVEKEQKFIPENLFKDFLLEKTLKEAISKRGYNEPTPIQDKVIPYILQETDVVGIANTGTGKTAAFLIPLINKVLINPSEKVLIVTPTRELANQIDQELKKLTPGMKIYSVCCVGGASIGPQIKSLQREHSFVVGTPGRLKDLIEKRKLKLFETDTIVLDEADVMLDMGFINDIRYLISKMPPVRHTLFFTATLSKDIEKLIHEFLRDPVSISVKKRNTSKNVEQDVVRTKGVEKIDKLHSLLIQPEYEKVLVFSRTKRGAEKLSIDLSKRGFNTTSIHGNKSYNQRQRALRSFKENRVQIMVATDVASRGLDIPNVSHVINYDIPNTYEDYIHRIGRTGRWGKKGKALTFV